MLTLAGAVTSPGAPSWSSPAVLSTCSERRTSPAPGEREGKLSTAMTKFSTASNVITGPEAVYENTWGTSDWTNPPGPTSWKCRCVQEPVQCQPEDSYEVGRRDCYHSLLSTLHCVRWCWSVTTPRASSPPSVPTPRLWARSSLTRWRRG